MLDDLGLIPALHSFVKTFSTRTGVHVHLKAFAGVEQLDTASARCSFASRRKRSPMWPAMRKASRVEVSIQKLPDGICMKIKDDGKSFQVERVLQRQGTTNGWGCSA